DHHDRTILVHLKAVDKNQIEIVVEYRLEVDEFTVITDDMKPFRDEVDPALFRDKGLAFYGEFTRIYAPIFAGNLLVQLNGETLKFTCKRRTQRLEDESGKALGHLRCDFTFRAVAPIKPDKRNVLVFRETNYRSEENYQGKIDLAFGKLEGM